VSPTPSPSADRFPVVIVGAGLAGLTAALHLAERGIEPLVLEADSAWPGGRLSGGEMDTFEYGGRTWSFRPDHGVHALWGSYDNTRAALRHFADVDLRLSVAEDWIDRWGSEIRVAEAGTAVRYAWLAAPFHYLMLLLRPKVWPTITVLDFLSLPGFLVSVLLTVGFDPIREQAPLDGLLMREFFRGWTRNLRVTFVGLGRNLLAAPDDVIPLASFIAALRFYTMLRRDAWTLEYLPGNAHRPAARAGRDAVSRRGGRLAGAAGRRLAGARRRPDTRRNAHPRRRAGHSGSRSACRAASAGC
jgi:isorenieratene synthase